MKRNAIPHGLSCLKTCSTILIEISVCVCVCVCVQTGSVLTLSVVIKLFREQVVAAAHTANGTQLLFGPEHPQSAGGQISTRMQTNQNCILGTSQRKERGKKKNKGVRG